MLDQKQRLAVNDYKGTKASQRYLWDSYLQHSISTIISSSQSVCQVLDTDGVSYLLLLNLSFLIFEMGL
jgi:hypothetical protein